MREDGCAELPLHLMTISCQDERRSSGGTRFPLPSAPLGSRKRNGTFIGSDRWPSSEPDASVSSEVLTQVEAKTKLFNKICNLQRLNVYKYTLLDWLQTSQLLLFLCPWARHFTLNCSHRGGQCLARQQATLASECVREWMNERPSKALWGTRTLLAKRYITAVRSPFEFLFVPRPCWWINPALARRFVTLGLSVRATLKHRVWKQELVCFQRVWFH